ncbi:MAG: 6-pyruvoyl tetrahydropterin synthase family protein [Fidelibacterota bacterium]
MPHITKVFKFSAAHQYGNPRWSEEKNREVFDKDVQIHGHDYTLEVTVGGKINPDTGFVVDLRELKRIVNEKVVVPMDHSVIEKDLPWFRGKQPSTENMVIWIWEQIEPELGNVALQRVRLRETSTIYSDYFGPEG